MKAMILAAGRGERMRPLTDHTPKPLAPFQSGRLIEPLLKSLYRGGIREVIINVCHLANQVIDFLGNGERYGLQLSYSIESYIGEFETGGGIIKALPLLGPQPFIVVSADIVSDFDFSGLIHKRLNHLAHLIMVKNPSFNAGGDFNLQKNGILTAQGDNMMTYSNMGILSPLLFSNYSLGKIGLGKIFRDVVNSGQITGEKYEGNWNNVGTLADLQNLNANLTYKNS